MPKFTDLPVISEPVERGDILCIVDVSDTTESPEGTSKQVTVAEVNDAISYIQIDDLDSGYSTRIDVEGTSQIRVTSTDPGFEGLKYRSDYSANYQQNTLITRADAPQVFFVADPPCVSGTVPTKIGDIYIDAVSNLFYMANGTVDCNNWVPLKSAASGVQTSAVQSVITGNTPTFVSAYYYTNVNNMITVKARFQVDTTGAHTNNFNIVLPIYPVADFALATQVIGSVQPWGFTTINHKVNHAQIIALTGTKFANIQIETDSSMNNLCQFLVDFCYRLS